jgi:hypothetical protein
MNAVMAWIFKQDTSRKQGRQHLRFTFSSTTSTCILLTCGLPRSRLALPVYLALPGAPLPAQPQPCSPPYLLLRPQPQSAPPAGRYTAARASWTGARADPRVTGTGLRERGCSPGILGIHRDRVRKARVRGTRFRKAVLSPRDLAGVAWSLCPQRHPLQFALQAAAARPGLALRRHSIGPPRATPCGLVLSDGAVFGNGGRGLGPLREGSLGGSRAS